ncbi:hypothetical protein ACSDR0_09525 [Streptosporangium sp. G11]|uniref:hypothetical protein n=1 Tax=Streptosporangium sp. G11 TaxID=3436926 RepID=UPI003EBFAAB9
MTIGGIRSVTPPVGRFMSTRECSPTSLERLLGGRAVTAWAVEPKLDGVALAARYRKGRLVQLVTRGDGTTDEEVSHAIGDITGLSAILTEPITVEVRGGPALVLWRSDPRGTVRGGLLWIFEPCRRSETTGRPRRSRPVGTPHIMISQGVATAWCADRGHLRTRAVGGHSC